MANQNYFNKKTQYFQELCSISSSLKNANDDFKKNHNRLCVNRFLCVFFLTGKKKAICHKGLRVDKGESFWNCCFPCQLICSRTKGFSASWVIYFFIE